MDYVMAYVNWSITTLNVGIPVWVLLLAWLVMSAANKVQLRREY